MIFEIQMNLLIFNLTISCLSILMGKSSALPTIERMEAIAAGQYYIAGSVDAGYYNLKLSPGAELYRNAYTLLWQGTFNDTIDVAIKIVSDQNDMAHEMNIFLALEATENFNIREHRIPRVYYYGPIFDGYFAIAMTLFERQTLEDRFAQQNHHFSDSTILLVFKQAVQALEYIHSKNVVHNDIKPQNIFIIGTDVFLGDFDRSKLEGNPMVDYELWLTWIWAMVGVPRHKIYGPNEDKLEHFNSSIVRKAFQFILNIDPICGRLGTVPNYKKIIKAAEKAIHQMEKSGPVKFDWL